MLKKVIVKSTCGLCHGGCGVLLHVENGRLVKVEGDPESPMSKGSLCTKGLAIKQLVYHPERLRYPMKRAGERGEGKWIKISWEEAINTIASKLNETKQKYGAETIALASGTGRPTVSGWAARAGYSIGTPSGRVGAPHICFSPRINCGTTIYGRPIQYHLEGEPACIMAVGGNFLYANADRNLAKRLLEAMDKCKKLIVVDPRFSSLASKAHLWLQIRPGTDCALFLGMLNVIINEKLYDKEFVEKWAVGFEELHKHVQAYPPEKVEKITWIPAKKIEEASRLYATLKPACLLLGVAVEMNVNCTDTVRAGWILPAITGNVDIPGGNFFWEGPLPPDSARKFTLIDNLPPEVFKKRVGWFPLLSSAANPEVWRAAATGKPYPIKMLLVHGCNPLVGHENTKLLYEALKKIEFIAVMDLLLTPTAELADIVLPATTYAEMNTVDSIFSGLTTGIIFPIQKAIEPLDECKSDIWFFIELAKAAGFDFGFKNEEEALNDILSPLGITFEEFKVKGPIVQPQRFEKYKDGYLRPDGKEGFNTPSGKIELYSERWKGFGLEPLPIHREPPESPVSTPELVGEYPLILITGVRIPVFFHTQYRQVPWLREIHPDPIVEVHPDTASKYGISDKDWVWIETRRGGIKQRAKLTLGIHPNVVNVEASWWFPEKPGEEPSLHGVWESNANVLVSNEPPYDPGSGSTPVRGMLCRIRKAD